MYINGKWRETNKKEEVRNPATEELVGEVYVGGQKEAEEAIQAAHEAFKEWRAISGQERGNLLIKVAEEMRKAVDSIAEMITKEMGKPISDARREVISGAAYLEWYGEEAKRVYGEVLPPLDTKKHLMVIRQPVGVIGAITPWNFPVSMITRKLGPALAAGCTGVLKPAPSTPHCAIEIFRCFERAGLPAGVANLVIGDAEAIGKEMTSNPIVKKITFTGSTNVGKLLMRNAAEHVQKVSMELGGHAPFIVFEDANLDDAVSAVVATKFKNSGQTCISTNRVYVQESILDEFSQRLAKSVADIKVGDGMEEDTDMGPLVNEAALSKVEDQVAKAASSGASIVAGGKRKGDKGYFYAPTVLANTTDDMSIAKEETFGPVAPIFSFKTEEEVVERANNTQYGLMGYCFTEDLGRSMRMMYQLEYGMVGINDAAPIVPHAPFGGVKESGIGREGGTSGLHEFMEEKFISIRSSADMYPRS
ncbi:NAD-dependent succinate-semialdehyde dehydrogenase [Alteribacillus iranensis]|uniref:Succinate semialdehyde dehydrogenase n=1 Tax=Alteribacillus iranensis TaxID=930128 RepID=A0A1I2E199_9BACI|nr:NAD-dependent succinate-semialdehyde dehydrogenase [Alteribacillus iranensis]SFE86635.1 succinate semialdehyde dehydrogenase [Alteribacillus iranensis]